MDHFEQINETSYLSVQNAPVYRKIMRCFYREYEKMHFQLYKEDIFQFLKEDDAFETVFHGTIGSGSGSTCKVEKYLHRYRIPEKCTR